jgi:AcrR family transcriptional regulator
MAYRETEKMRQRKAAARQRIAECTYQCVTEGGFRNARITRVAQLAGVATGTIYRHYESKEDLFAEIFRLATQREMDKVAEALAAPGNATVRLEKALRQFAERALKGPVMAWSLIAEPVDPKVEEERLAYRKAYANLFEQAIREGIEEGCIPDQDARPENTQMKTVIATWRPPTKWSTSRPRWKTTTCMSRMLHFRKPCSAKAPEKRKAT